MPNEQRLSIKDYTRTVELLASLDSNEPDPKRRGALRGILGHVTSLLQAGGEAADILSTLPHTIHRAMGEFGWNWNGFFVLEPDGRLHLGHAHGPPVCADLERSGGVLTSGMCFDSLLLNQTLAVPNVSRWPGYVSCDGHSGLTTLGGIVSPIRNQAGTPLGVWDLDSSQVVTASDGRFIEALLASLAVAVVIRAADLRQSSGPVR